MENEIAGLDEHYADMLQECGIPQDEKETEPNYTIGRTCWGIDTCNRPIDGEDKEIFEHAVNTLYFLVGWNESISGEEWVKRIEAQIEESPRRNATVEAIKKAMFTT